MNLFTEMNSDQLELSSKRNALLKQQDELKVHHYRTNLTVLTDDDRKYDALQKEIDAIESLTTAG